MMPIRMKFWVILATLATLAIALVTLYRPDRTAPQQSLGSISLRQQEISRIPLREIDRKLALWNIPRHTIENLFGNNEEPQFLPQYKNPCWRDDKAGNGIQCMPYVYELGAAKGGTTTMYKLIIKHPDVALPSTKEPHYWEFIKRRPLFESYFLPIYKNATRDIHQQVDSAGYHRMVTIEASPTSFTTQADFTNIPGNLVNGEVKYSMAHSLYALNPKTKLIVVLRDPASRLYSHYHGVCRVRGGFSPESFHNKSVARLAKINKCLTTRPVRSCIFDESVFPYPTQIKEFGGELSFHYSLYHPFAVEWLKVFPRQQILFIKSEEMYADGPATMKRVFEFLELPEASEAVYEEIQQMTSTHYEQPLTIALDVTYRGSMLKETSVLLNDFFRPYNERLAELLGDRKWLFL